MEQNRSYKLVMISNYINHHQIPFCNAMYDLLNGSFAFIQTQPMEQERVSMGWQENGQLPYLKLYYENTLYCKKLIAECETALFGGTDEESYIAERLQSGKPLIRYSERLYKTGQWKAVSPKGLLKKYHDHTRYRKAPVYLLCSGAYVPSDFHIVGAYPHKMFCWGYFPETKHYDVDMLLKSKGYEQRGGKVPYLLWAARFIDWKHPELPLRAAAYLRDRGLAFHMDMVGGGVMEPEMRELWRALHLEDVVTFTGYQTPAQVRERMERADIYLLTSDRQEGWGAVANEAMNSGCALVSNHMVGAAPYLVQQGRNGFLYQDGNERMLFQTVERLARDGELCRELGRNAYRTITEVWNAENAAKNLLEFIRNTVLADRTAESDGLPDLSGLAESNEREYPYPCAPAPVIPERKMWRRLTEPENRFRG